MRINIFVGALAVLLGLLGSPAHAATIGVTQALGRPDIAGSATLSFVGSGGNGTLTITGTPTSLRPVTGPQEFATGGSFTLHATIVASMATVGDLSVTFDPSGPGEGLQTWFFSNLLLKSGFGSTPFPRTFEFVFRQGSSPSPAYATRAPAPGTAIGVSAHDQGSGAIDFSSNFSETVLFDVAPVPLPSSVWGGGLLLLGLGASATRRRGLQQV